jgi:strawberry notch-like protein/conjugative element/phage-associated large polyvalent protein
VKLSIPSTLGSLIGRRPAQVLSHRSDEDAVDASLTLDDASDDDQSPLPPRDPKDPLAQIDAILGVDRRTLKPIPVQAPVLETPKPPAKPSMKTPAPRSTTINPFAEIDDYLAKTEHPGVGDPKDVTLKADKDSEPAFRSWYDEQAQRFGLNPDPDAADQHYDYRAAFRAGAQPDASGHWPSTFKTGDHPNLVVGGFNTKTGERVPGTPRASEQELVRLGWSPADAKRLTQGQDALEAVMPPTPDLARGRAGRAIQDRTIGESAKHEAAINGLTQKITPLQSQVSAMRTDLAARLDAFQPMKAELAATGAAYAAQVKAFNANGRPEADRPTLEAARQAFNARVDAVNQYQTALEQLTTAFNGKTGELNTLIGQRTEAATKARAAIDAANRELAALTPPTETLDDVGPAGTLRKLGVGPPIPSLIPGRGPIAHVPGITAPELPPLATPDPKQLLGISGAVSAALRGEQLPTHDLSHVQPPTWRQSFAMGLANALQTQVANNPFLQGLDLAAKGAGAATGLVRDVPTAAGEQLFGQSLPGHEQEPNTFIGRLASHAEMILAGRGGAVAPMSIPGAVLNPPNSFEAPNDEAELHRAEMGRPGAVRTRGRGEMGALEVGRRGLDIVAQLLTDPVAVLTMRLHTLGEAPAAAETAATQLIAGETTAAQATGLTAKELNTVGQVSGSVLGAAFTVDALQAAADTAANPSATPEDVATAVLNAAVMTVPQAVHYLGTGLKLANDRLARAAAIARAEAAAGRRIQPDPSDIAVRPTRVGPPGPDEMAGGEPPPVPPPPPAAPPESRPTAAQPTPPPPGEVPPANPPVVSPPPPVAPVPPGGDKSAPESVTESGAPTGPLGPAPTLDPRDNTEYRPATLPGLYRGARITAPTGHTGTVIESYDGPAGSGRGAFKVEWDNGETTVVSSFRMKVELAARDTSAPESKPPVSQAVPPAPEQDTVAPPAAKPWAEMTDDEQAAALMAELDAEAGKPSPESVQPTGAKLHNESAVSPAGQFTTAKGSVYQVDGSRTSRQKRATGEAFGASDRTMYLDPDTASRAQAHIDSFNQGDTTARPQILEDGRIAIVVKDKATGQVRDDLTRVVEGQDAPAVGLHPFEVWKKTPTGERSWHFGNAITSIEAEKPSAESELTPNAFRQEVESGQSTTLDGPRWRKHSPYAATPDNQIEDVLKVTIEEQANRHSAIREIEDAHAQRPSKRLADDLKAIRETYDGTWAELEQHVEGIDLAKVRAEIEGTATAPATSAKEVEAQPVEVPPATPASGEASRVERRQEAPASKPATSQPAGDPKARAIAAMERAVEYREKPKAGAVHRLDDDARKRVIQALANGTHEVVDVKEPHPGIVTITYKPKHSGKTITNAVRLPEGTWPDGTKLPDAKVRPERPTFPDPLDLPDGQVLDAQAYADRYFGTSREEDEIDDLRASAKAKPLNKKDQRRLDDLKQRVKDRKGEAKFLYRLDTMLVSPDTGWLKGEDDLPALSDLDLGRLEHAVESRARLEGKTHALKAFDDPRVDAIKSENERRYDEASKAEPIIDLTGEPAPTSRRTPPAKIFEHAGKLYVKDPNGYGVHPGNRSADYEPGIYFMNGYRVVPREDYRGWIPERTEAEYEAGLSRYLPWEFAGLRHAWADLDELSDAELRSMIDVDVAKEESRGHRTGVVVTVDGKTYVVTGERAKFKVRTVSIGSDGKPVKPKAEAPASKPAVSQPAPAKTAAPLQPKQPIVTEAGLANLKDLAGRHQRAVDERAKDPEAYDRAHIQQAMANEEVQDAVARAGDAARAAEFRPAEQYDAAARGVPYDQMSDAELRELLDIGVGDEPQKAATEMQRRQGDQQAYSPEAIATAFNLTKAQAAAVDALVDAMGIDTTELRIAKGGAPGDGALLAGDIDRRVVEGLRTLSDRLRYTPGSTLARRAAKRHFVGEPLTNIEQGITATVSGDSLGKMLSTSAVAKSVSPQAHMMAVGNLDALFPLATLQEERPPKDPEHVNVVRYFDVPMPMAGDVVRVHIMALEHRDSQKGTRLYMVQSLAVENNAGVVGRDPLSGDLRHEDDVLASPPPPGVTPTFARMIALVKGSPDALYQAGRRFYDHELSGVTAESASVETTPRTEGPPEPGGTDRDGRVTGAGSHVSNDVPSSPDRTAASNTRADVSPTFARVVALVKGEPDTLYQGPKGAAEFAADGKAIVRGLEAADVSTAVHEFFHVARRQKLNRNVPLAQRGGITDEDLDEFEAWAGAEDGWTREAEETAARAFERYLHEGTAPTPVLAKLFKAIADWLKQIYQRLTGSEIDIRIPDAIRAIFDKLVTIRDRARNGGHAWDDSEVVNAYQHLVADDAAPISQLEGAIAAFSSWPSYLRESVSTAQLQGHLRDIARIREQLADVRTEHDREQAEEDLGDDLEASIAIVDKAERIITRELQRRDGQNDLFVRRPTSAPLPPASRPATSQKLASFDAAADRRAHAALMARMGELTDDDVRRLDSVDDFGNPLSPGDLGLDLNDDTENPAPPASKAADPTPASGQRAQLESMADTDLQLMAKSTRLPAVAKLAAEILAQRKAASPASKPVPPQRATLTVPAGAGARRATSEGAAAIAAAKERFRQAINATYETPKARADAIAAAREAVHQAETDAHAAAPKTPASRPAKSQPTKPKAAKEPKALAPGTIVLSPKDGQPVPRSWQRSATDAERAVIFQPGNIVQSYAGVDTVISYTPTSADGLWRVIVQRDGEGQRGHATNPEVIKDEYRDRVKPEWVFNYTAPGAPAAAPAKASGSFKVEISDGRNWSSNQLRYATKEEAEAAGRELMSRWMGARDMRVAESTDPVNRMWDAKEGRSVELQTAGGVEFVVKPLIGADALDEAKKQKAREERARLIAELKAKKADGPDTLYQDPDASKRDFDVEDVKALVNIVRTYIDEGMKDFATAIRQFQEDFGAGARRLDRPFEMAWKRWTGEDRRAAEHLTAAPPPGPAAAPKPLHVRIYDLLRERPIINTSKDGRELRQNVSRALANVSVKELENDIDSLNDPVEAALAATLRDSLANREDIRQDLSRLVYAAQQVENTLPRAHRTLEKMQLQQFSTPLPLAVAADYAAQISAGDHVLEPTAGTGNLLVAVPPGVTITANELSPRRADLLRAQGYAVEVGDYLKARLTPPTVIITNPPWGKYSTGKYGRGVALEFAPNDVAERFVAKNLRDLVDGGRLVAVMPTTMLESTSFKKWLRDTYAVRAIIKSPPKAYDSRATSVDSVLLVVDKVKPEKKYQVFTKPPENRLVGTFDSLADATAFMAKAGIAHNIKETGGLPRVVDAPDWKAYISAVEGIHDRSPITAAEGRAPGAAGSNSGSRSDGVSGSPRPGRPGPRRDAPVGAGRPADVVAGDTRHGGVPRRGRVDADATSSGVAAEPAGAAALGVSGPTDDARREAAASRFFAPYLRRTAHRGQPHPKLLVEAKQLAGVPYPALTTQPTPSMAAAIVAGRVSVEQAEQALAVLQANSGPKPHGYLAADAVGVGKSREIAMTLLGAMDRAQAGDRQLRLMLTTKTRDNVEDLLDEIHFVASGQTSAQGGSVPFEIYRLADDYPGAKKAGNEYEPLPKATRAVYVVDSFNVADYRQALADVDLHGIVGDEVQRFTNQEAQIGAAWLNLHARVMRNVPREQQFFAYFTATPAQKVEDYRYLYGLRLWPVDGFADWLQLVTGNADEKKARELAEATERGSVQSLDDILKDTDVAVVGTDSDSPNDGKKKRPRSWDSRASDVFAQRLTPAEGEQIPREWKMLGRFSARDLWRAGTTFEIHEFKLTDAHRQRYDQFVDLALDIYRTAYKYGLYDKTGKSSRFGVTGILQFAAKRIQMQPALEEAVRLAKQFAGEGYQPVLSIINVSEMTADRGHLIAAIDKINTRMVDDDPNDPDAGPVDLGEIPEAVIDRARLLDRVRDLGAFPDPIQYIADALGPEKVAFIIGKEKSSRRKASAEFQTGDRTYAVISGAGSTGINLDQRIETPIAPGHGRRVFLDVQYEWSAMEGVQRYGRVDRASSIHPPRLIALTSGNAAEKKFLATIANRMAALGALSKGGAESTGAAGNALEEFEITGDDALAAARRAYEESSDETKRSFATIKSAFRDPNRNGKSPDREDFDPFKPSRDAHGVGMLDFQLPLLLMPMDQANAFWEKFIRYRDELRAESGERELMRAARFSGQILETHPLKPHLDVYAVKNEQGQRFGILVGLITPEMPRLRELLKGARDTAAADEDWTDTADVTFRRRYVTFSSGDAIITGLQVPFTRIPAIAKAYGQLVHGEKLDTPEKVLAHLRGGETITLGAVNPDSGKHWILRMRPSDRRIAIDHARMADRTVLSNNGAGYQPVGNYWHVTDLAKFLERWPVPDQVREASPKPKTPPASSGGSGGFTAQSAVIPGAKEFVEQDVTPAIAEAVARAGQARREIRALFAPDTAGEGARLFADSMRANLAAYAQKLQRARKLLKAAQDAFDPLAGRADAGDVAAIDEFLAFTDVMDGTAPLDSLAPELQEIATVMRDLNRKRLRQIQALGRLRDKNGDDYFGRIWKTDRDGHLLIKGPGGTGRRPLQGRGAFLKQRTWKTMREGVEEGATPVTWNPVEMFLLKLAEQDRWIMGRTVLLEGKSLGVTKFVRVGDTKRIPEGWRRYHESFGTVWGPPRVKVKEAFDRKLMDGLYTFARALGVGHVRKVAVGGQRWGYAVGAHHVVTKFAGPEGVLMHEIGHILDERFGLRNKWVNNPKMRKELQNLADLRFEGTKREDVPPSRRRYYRKAEEKIANLVHAFLYAPDKAKKVAPNAYWALHNLAKQHTVLRPLLDLQRDGRSLTMAVGTAEVSAGGAVIRGHYYGPEDAVRILDNYLSKGLRGNAAFDTYRQIGNFMNQVQLGLSGFHLTMTGIEAMVSKVAQGFEELSRGEGLQAGKSLLEAPVATLTTLIKGDRVLKQLYAKDANARLITGVTDLIVQGGGGIHRDQTMKVYDDRVGQVMRALRRGNVLGAAVRLPLAAFELPTKFVMEWWVPRLKLGAYMDLARMELRTLGPEPSLREIRRVLGGVQDSIDDRFGQLIYDNLFWSNTLKDIGMASFRALGWNVGTTRTVFGAPLGQAAQIGALVTGKSVGGYRPLRMTHTGNDLNGQRIFEPTREPWLTHKGAYLLAMVFGVGLLGALYEYLHTGERPKEWRDYFFPRTGQKRPDGKDERVSFPSYFKDVYSVSQHPIDTLGHKLQPEMNLMYEILNNEDFYGTEVRHPGDPIPDQARDVWDHVLGSFAPFTLRSFQQRKQDRGATSVSGAESFFGVTPAPASIYRTKAEKMMQSFLPPLHRTKEEAEAARQRRSLRDAFRRGDVEAQAEVFAGGTLSSRQIKNAQRMSGQTALQSGFQRLTAEQAFAVYAVATPAERAELRGMVIHKGALIKRQPPAAQAELWRRYREALSLPVAAAGR